jgi:hypothetical protein
MPAGLRGTQAACYATMQVQQRNDMPSYACTVPIYMLQGPKIKSLKRTPSSGSGYGPHRQSVTDAAKIKTAVSVEIREA